MRSESQISRRVGTESVREMTFRWGSGSEIGVLSGKRNYAFPSGQCTASLFCMSNRLEL